MRRDDERYGGRSMSHHAGATHLDEAATRAAPLLWLGLPKRAGEPPRAAWLSSRVRLARRLSSVALCVVAVLVVAGVGSAFAEIRPAGTPPLSLSELPFPLASASTPEQVAADQVSRTAHSGLDREAAVSLAAQSFHVDQPSWTPPGTEQSGQIQKYLGEHAAVEKLPTGEHVVLSSSIPLRADGGSGPKPVSLTLHAQGESFVPENPLVPIAISTHASGGIVFPAGLSVAPVSAAAEAPVVVGNRVMFANSSRDTDIIAEPRPSGAELSWQLRSQESPQDEALAFTLPPGATLQPSTSEPEAVEVAKEGTTLLFIPPAVAQGADGSPVPVSYSIEKNVLTTHVDLSGNVDFPVLVDPTLFYGYSGVTNGANVWNGWNQEGSFEYLTFYNLIQVGTNPGASIGAYAGWTVWAPGLRWDPGSAGITRVDLTGVTHNPAGQSQLRAGIGYVNGHEPIYTFNGNTGAGGYSPLLDPYALPAVPIAFCAQQGGGHDGGEPPLCEESAHQGETFEIGDEILTTQTVFNYVRIEGAAITYRDPAAPNFVQLEHPGYTGQWLKTGPTNFTIYAEDEGLGIAHFEMQIPAGQSPTFKQDINCNVQNGFTGCPTKAFSEPINLSGVKGTGELSLAPVATDAAENVARPSKSYVPLYLDQTAPVMGALSGSLYEVSGGVIGDHNYTLNFSAVDGSKQSASTVQSGVRSLEVKVDGKSADTVNTACSAPIGFPAEGCYGLSGSWTMNGQTYGAGVHTITVVAKDWVGNESSESFKVTVNEAAYVPTGPGAVNLQSGDFKMTPTDVSLSGGLASLSVSRTYDSRNLLQGLGGPLGPQWLLSLPDSAAAGEWQSLSVTSDGSVEVLDGHGDQVFFKKEGATYTSPAGYQTDTLTEPSTSPVIYQITNAQGDYTKFAQPSGSTAFVPSSAAQATAAGGLNRVTYASIRTAEGILEPTEVLGPEPSEGACAPTLVKGCRALTFGYATSTTATGEASSEWGEFKGRLTKVSFTAWDPAKSEMTTTAVAQYSYDKFGRLRAEWDPRISPVLKTSYGYDSEGHVTAVTPPGQQPWLLHYGTSSTDTSAGRLLSASRFNAETALWKGEVLTNTAAPKLSSTSPRIGTSLSVSSATWSTASVSYGFQWERCNSSGGECTVIPGATNQTYTPLTSDAGHELLAQVTATNAAGTAAASSTASSVVAAGAPVYSMTLGTSGAGAGQIQGPEAVALAASGYAWVADSGNHRLDQYSPSGTFVQAIGWGVNDGKEELESCTATCKGGIAGGKAGEINDPTGIAINQSTGNMYVADSAQHHIEEFSPTGAYIRTIGSFGHENGQLDYPYGLTVDSSENVWVADSGNCRVEEFSNSGVFISAFGTCGTGTGQLKMPADIAFAGGNLYVTDVENSRVQEFKPSGEWVRAFGTSGSGPGQFTTPWGIAADPQNGDLYVTSYGDGRVEAFSPEGNFVEQFGHLSSEREGLAGPEGLAINPSTGAIYIADEWVDRVDVWMPPTLTQEPTQPPPNPGTAAATTIDYQVPLSGSGVPQMTPTEVAKWAQTKDIPAEATAIFPPDEPQGWPATDYKRANIFYLDSTNRTVNTASPSGAITTTEYSKTNNVERTLTADNREAALKEGSKSAEMSQLLDTQNTYSPEGTQLTSTLGPEHKVKLANGSEVSARKHTQYWYDEGAPGGGPYDLVTKTTEGAQSVGQEEKDRRTVTTGYGGQENLGWKLHAPTSATTSTGTEELTTTTTYEPATGAIKETHTPTSTRGAQPLNVSQFGSKGAGAGQLNAPADLALDSKGNFWVVDTGNSRIEEFNEKSVFVKQFGTEGLGKLKSPIGIALDPKGDVWVTDSGDYRVVEFNEKGEYIKAFGTQGHANGQFESPQGIAIDAHGNTWVADSGSPSERVEEFNEKGEFVKGIGQNYESVGKINAPRGLTIDRHGNIWIAAARADGIVEFSEKGEYIKTIAGTGANKLEEPDGVAVDAQGNVWSVDASRNRLEEFNEKGEFESSAGSEGTGMGQFNFIGGRPDVIVDEKQHLWITDPANARVAKWLAPKATTGNAGAHTSVTIYYSAGANGTYPTCGSHAEWAGLPCQAQPAAQPGTSGLANLPVTTYTYDIWDKPLTTTDTIGTTTRTATLTYDAAGRALTSAISSSAGTSLPTVSDEYAPETGGLIKQSTPTKAITSTYNTLGQLTSYTDADGGVTKYEYEKEKDGRLVHVSEGEGTPAASTQTYGYDATTGELVSLKDSGAGTFGAAYDAEGNLFTKSYPNGMNAIYSRNSVGQTTGLEYLKTSHCSSGCTWYTDAATPSIHGQWLTQASSVASNVSKQSYSYDEVGRLTEVQEAPAGKGCATRLYAYDEDGNRTAQVTREPGAEGKCSIENATNESYAYDTADRLIESGVTYDTFGNVTGLPAADAGGAPLASTYYVNNTLASQEQSGEKLTYGLDAAGRTRETVATGTVTSTVTSHYAGPEASPAWTITSSGSWTRTIAALGGLAATQSNGEAPVLQLANLHGDIIGSASTSETESKFVAASETTEYGVPRTSISSKYSWLGSGDVATELPTGIIDMGARAYIPQLGRYEQSDPQPGGSIDAYAYTFDDPVNQADPGGEWTNTITYNYEAAETGQAAAGLPEDYAGPGAILPPPEDLQAEAEFAAHPPWDAASTATANPLSEVGEWAQPSDGSDPIAVAAAPCQGHDDPHAGSCGAHFPGRELCSNPLLQGCRVVISAPRHARLGRLKFNPDGGVVGCLVGGTIGGSFAIASTAGLAVQAGAYGGCFIGGGLVILVEAAL
jgi:RHS repeat-associated protein